MQETALDARVSPETLRKIETGRVATPSFSTIAAIADVLGLSLDEVWAEISRPDSDAASTGLDDAASTGRGEGTRERLAPSA